MVKTTDLESIKEVAKNLLGAVPITDSLIVSHPFTQSNVALVDNKVLNLCEHDDFVLWYKCLSDLIDSCTDYYKIYIYITKPYKLAFLKFTKQFMTLDLFSDILKDAYTTVEFPNRDRNVSPRELKRWFKQADKAMLMSKEEYEVYTNLPSTVTVYRGVDSLKGAKGLSWTLNLKTAQWFSTRFRQKDSFVLCSEVPKEKILAYFNDRNEYEVVVDTTNIEYKVM